jgi:hypothetical protein
VSSDRLTSSKYEVFRQVRIIITATLIIVVATVLAVDSAGKLPDYIAAALLTMVGFAVIAAHRRQASRSSLAGPRGTLSPRAAIGIQH